MENRVVITGIGLVTPLGRSAAAVLAAIARHDVAPHRDGCAVIDDFDAEEYFPENKTLRLMNRDARLAVAAARLATRDAGLLAGQTYAAEEIALFGATGLTGLPADEVDRLVKFSAAADGSLDLRRFGEVALKRVRPVLSFKILANMPICFVSIFEDIRGENAVYTPWEGQCAQAIAAGVRAVRHGRSPCALVGGCDVKTHEFARASLEQLGALNGGAPGEGAAFLVLEDEARARARGARIHARIASFSLRSTGRADAPHEVFKAVLDGLDVDGVDTLVAAGGEAEDRAVRAAGIRPARVIRAKRHVGNLFAAAAAVQVALAAETAAHDGNGHPVLANCFGHGSQHGAFVLEAI